MGTSLRSFAHPTNRALCGTGAPCGHKSSPGSSSSFPRSAWECIVLSRAALSRLACARSSYGLACWRVKGFALNNPGTSTERLFPLPCIFSAGKKNSLRSDTFLPYRRKNTRYRAVQSRRNSGASEQHQRDACPTEPSRASSLLQTLIHRRRSQLAGDSLTRWDVAAT